MTGSRAPVQSNPDGISASCSNRLISLFLALTVLLTLGVMYARPIEDGDTWFHLAYGRYIVENRTLVPDHTVFSWTPARGDEIYCAWIPEVLLYFLFQKAGIAALFVLRYACLLAFLGFASFYAWRMKVFWQPLTWLIFLLGILMSRSGVLIKAEMFSYVLMGLAVYVWWSIRLGGEKQGWRCYLFPAIILIWVNSHGGVIFGLTFLGTIFLGECLNGLLSPGEKLPPGTRKHFFAALFICCLAMLVTPYGWEYPAQLVQNFLVHPQGKIEDFMTQGAYQSIYHPQAAPLHLVEYLVFGVVILGLLWWPRIRAREIDWCLVLTNLVFCLLYMRFIRTTYFWAIVFTFTALSLFAERPLKIKNKGLSHVRHLQAAFILIAGLILGGRAVHESICSPLFGFWVNYVNPVEESVFIRENLSGLRLGNDYESGSYLLWAFGPERKVFIDSRYFPYKGWYDEYTSFREGREVDRFLEKYSCEVWCLTYDFPGLAFFARSPEWKLVHYGPSACLFVRSDTPVQIHGPRSNVFAFNLDVFQAYKILQFALKAGELDTAQEIIARVMSRRRMCSKQEALAVQAHMELAAELEKMGLTERSLDLCRAAAERSPDNADIFIRTGDLLVKKGSIDEAIEQYRRALSIDPESMGLLNKLSLCYAGKGDYGLALECLQRMLALDPENSTIYYNISCIYAKQGAVHASVSWLESAVSRGFNDWGLLKIDPDLASIRDDQNYIRLIQGH